MATLLQDWVAGHAQRSPERRAIVSAAGQLTYGELDALSTQVARVLKARGCQRGDRIALFMPKSPMAIVGLLGIYKAECIYVPLDPSSPASRLKKVLDACDNRWLLAAGTATAPLEELLRLEGATLRVGWLDAQPPRGEVRAEFTLADVTRYPTVPLACESRPDSPAHILFTSGSTGTPKGVVITHANVIHFVEWATKYFGMDAADRVSCHPPLHFDLSFLDIFGTAAVGAELHLVPPELNVLPHRLADFIRVSELTQWFSVPSLLNYMAKSDVVRVDDFPSLKRVLWCGEVLPTPALIQWMERLPHVRFTNLYGPTETTIASSYYTVPACPADGKAPIPIGTACDGEELLVLDDSLQPVEPGGTGDLYIAGVGLAAGYWRDSERTDAVFVRDPRNPSGRIYKTGDLATVAPDGLVYFLGRNDSQIKSRGYRIELGEIEAAANTVPGVQECAVVAIDTEGFEGKVIGCAYVPAAGTGLTPVALRRELSRLLPGYMLPARWLAFDRFPKNANGKIDRPKVREAFEIQSAQTA